MEGGDERDRRIGEVFEFVLEGQPECIRRLGIAFPEIPLVHHQNAGTARLVGLAADVGVLGRDALHPIDQGQDHVGAAHGRQRSRDAVAFHRPPRRPLARIPAVSTRM